MARIPKFKQKHSDPLVEDFNCFTQLMDAIDQGRLTDDNKKLKKAFIKRCQQSPNFKDWVAGLLKYDKSAQVTSFNNYYKTLITTRVPSVRLQRTFAQQFSADEKKQLRNQVGDAKLAGYGLIRHKKADAVGVSHADKRANALNDFINKLQALENVRGAERVQVGVPQAILNDKQLRKIVVEAVVGEPTQAIPTSAEVQALFKDIKQPMLAIICKRAAFDFVSALPESKRGHCLENNNHLNKAYTQAKQPYLKQQRIASNTQFVKNTLENFVYRCIDLCDGGQAKAFQQLYQHFAKPPFHLDFTSPDFPDQLAEKFMREDGSLEFNRLTQVMEAMENDIAVTQEQAQSLQHVAQQLQQLNARLTFDGVLQPQESSSIAGYMLAAKWGVESLPKDLAQHMHQLYTKPDGRFDPQAFKGFMTEFEADVHQVLATVLAIDKVPLTQRAVAQGITSAVHQELVQRRQANPATRFPEKLRNAARNQLFSWRRGAVIDAANSHYQRPDVNAQPLPKSFSPAQPPPGATSLSRRAAAANDAKARAPSTPDPALVRSISSTRRH